LDDLEARDDGGPVVNGRVRSPAEVAPDRRITPEELLAMPEGKYWELIDGRARERPSNALAALTVTELSWRLGDACHREKLGSVLAGTLGYRCFPWNPNLIRRSNLSLIRADRLTPERMSESYCAIPPDLALDMVYPGDLAEYHARKLEDYFRAGVRLIWLVSPRHRTVHVYRSDRSGRWLRSEDELSGEDVIPGFRCRVADLFPGPAGDESAAPPQSEVTQEALAR
jgi:Uma2 family endonuclease